VVISLRQGPLFNRVPTPDDIAPVLPPVPIEMDDWQPELLAEGARNSRLPGTDASDYGGALHDAALTHSVSEYESEFACADLGQLVEGSLSLFSCNRVVTGKPAAGELVFVKAQ